MADNVNNSTVLGTFSGKCCDAAVFNNNDMKLNRELFEILIDSDDYKTAMQNRYYIGYLGHPEDPNCMDFKDACIVMTSMEIRDDDEVWGTFDLVDTPVGRVVKAFIDAGVTFGISIRGAGDVDSEGNVDPETFVFRGFDLVTFPAYSDAVPEFKQIAASTSLDDQVKYKRVCVAINKNIQNITASSSLNIIQSQFNPDSKEYKQLEARKHDIGTDSCEDDCCDGNCEDELQEITAKKLSCMTDMYIEQCQANSELKSELVQATTEYDRKLKSIKRISASQSKLMKSALSTAQDSEHQALVANKQLKIKLQESRTELTSIKASTDKLNSKIKSLEKSNLIYKQKIECSKQDISDRDATISDLQSKLHKTVVASSEVNREKSNRDEEIAKLKSELVEAKGKISEMSEIITATEEALTNYQQAYADIFATAIGTSVSDISVTASTTVSELEHMISSATNTSNIPVSPSFDNEAPDIFEFDSDEDTLVTL